MSAHPLRDARERLVEATKGISALCVRRPVLTIVLNLLVVVAGLAAYGGVEIRELPDVDRPVVTVRATYEGATPRLPSRSRSRTSARTTAQRPPAANRRRATGAEPHVRPSPP